MKLVRLDDGRITARRELPTPGSRPARDVIDSVSSAVRGLLGDVAPDAAALGIAVPGFLDGDRTTVLRLSNLPALDGVPLAREIERRTGVRPVLDADSNAGAIAEARRGAGRRSSRVLYVTLGTGLGAAFVVDGEVVRVSRHTWGQVAHVPLGEAGPRCYCGRQGCAETLLSSRGILWRARQNGLEGVASCEELARMARRGSRRGSRAARAVWSGSGEALGRLLTILAALVSPDAIVIGGGISGAAGLFLGEARLRLVDGIEEAHRPRIALVPAGLGRFAGAIGAALLARDAVAPRAR